MNKNKALKTAYIAAFLCVCMTPLCLWPFFKNEEPIGKTELAPPPSVTDESGNINADFFSDFDDYFTEHLTFRSQLVTADNFLKSQLFDADAGNVVTGSDGYIFSKETLNDYVGKTFSNRKIKNIARTVKLMQDKAVSTGNNFVFMVAPNKNTVYPEYMPTRYTKGEASNLSLLTNELGKLGVNYTDLKAVLQSQDKQLYLKRDTHWNNLGALYGFNAIMESLGKDSKDYNGLEYTYEKRWRGDLDKMLYPSGGILDNQYYFNHNYDNLSILMPRLEGDNCSAMEELMGDSEKKDSLIKTRNLKAQGNLLMVRDSFGRAMLPFLVDNYRTTTITRSQPFSMTSLVPQSNTDVVYEIVERNLGNIVKSAPVMEAMECDAPKADVIGISDRNLFNADVTDSYIKIYGVLDERYFTDDSRIFVILSSETESKSYEAFPVCETELLGLDDESDYGYSMTVSRNLPSGTYSVSAVVTNDSNGNKGTDVLGEFTI